jgi:uncharacterized protein YkwD|tara:strand:- start:279 stop:905 length:627 start_codon:yes stop_codon:yes gene_type:complete
LSCGVDSKSKETGSAKTSTNKSTKPVKRNTTKSVNKVNAQPETKMSKAVLSSTVTLGNIDYQLINARLFQKINKERKRLGLPLFKSNNDLNKAAKIHNDYMVRVDILDHNESGTSIPTMRDRVTKAGGKFRTAGENIQYEGFTIRTTNGVGSIIAPTYEALAEQLWQNWKTSPPHYKNLINPEFIYLGTSLKWSGRKTAVFATQVYGG